MGIRTASPAGWPLIVTEAKRKSRIAHGSDLPQEMKKTDEDRDEAIAERIRAVLAERGSLTTRDALTREVVDMIW